jgi:hypothetical protein
MARRNTNLQAFTRDCAKLDHERRGEHKNELCEYRYDNNMREGGPADINVKLLYWLEDNNMREGGPADINVKLLYWLETVRLLS